ncbi:hypothetical protein TNCV_4233791 [Trichonephila clavipes]|nr:hypothetical protein TNCV_4233791 [Trichonephila clavipes]
MLVDLEKGRNMIYSSNITERCHYSSPGVIVWGGIRQNEFSTVSVIGYRYCKEVILPHVRLFRGAIGPNFVFIDDNTTPACRFSTVLES